MANVTIRNLSDEVHRAIRLRAAQHGHSTEAEMRDLLSRSVQSPGRLKLGSELRRHAAALGGVELEIRRDPTPIAPADFSQHT